MGATGVDGGTKGTIGALGVVAGTRGFELPGKIWQKDSSSVLRKYQRTLPESD